MSGFDPSFDSTFDWSVYKGNLKWLPERTIYLTVHGSRAYGTHTPESDTDIRGVCIPPKPYYLGSMNTFEQAEQHEPDLTIFELKKFLKLASDCNPNVIEVLFTDDSSRLVCSPLGERLLANRELFLSKKAKSTFSGYAISQLRRIERHHAWHTNPPKAPPTRAEFGLPERTLMPADQLMAANAAIQKKLDEWSIHFLDGSDPDLRIDVLNKMHEYLAEIQVSMDKDLWVGASRTLGYDDNFIEVLDKERRYTSKQREWEQYQTWKRDRNPLRAALEAKYGYDCYADDTEFLTSNGWKRFDDIGSGDQLATVFVRRGIDPDATMIHRPFLGVEYQDPTDRFDAVYNGPMYHISGQHTDSLVTANHRMLFQKVERRSEIRSDWVLEEAAALPDTFDVLVAPPPRTTTYSNKDIFAGLPIPVRAYLTLMGWYLSDGHATFDTDGDMHVKSVRISQEPSGKLAAHMAKWQTWHGEKGNSSLYQYTRDPSAYNPVVHEERILDVRHPEIAQRMVSECGFKKSKRIPRYAFNLSKNLMEYLLIGLIRGDGTKREHKTKSDSSIYYSSSKDLASDVQELAMMSGWETALWGPYQVVDQEGRETEMYQVHLRREGERTRRFVRFQNVEKIEVQGQRVVCFTVPNGTLITRRNGKVAIHGNCKHGYHLVRLLRMCREILTYGKVLVMRPDWEELVYIRHGGWPYEKLVEWAYNEDKALWEVQRASSLPKGPDSYKIDQLCIGMLEASFLY